MSARDDRQARREDLAALGIALVTGLLHRRSIADAWADDRSPAADPAWLQMAAPRWHSAIADSPSIASWLLQAIDPLTSASGAGDLRAIAAAMAGVSAGLLFLVLRRAGVRTLIAAPLCGVTVGTVLPVAPAASASHALLLLLGTTLILTATSGRAGLKRAETHPPNLQAFKPPLRIALLALVTLLGGVTHVGFLAFAAGIWVAEWRQIGPGSRARVAIAGLTVLAVTLLLSSLLLAQHRPLPFDLPIAWPDALSMATGLITGRFDGPLQPPRLVDLLSAVGASVPAPMILSIPLAALAFVRRETRALAIGCALPVAFVLVFLWDTWLPDPRVAGAPARLAVAVLLGLGLSWVAAQPGRGAVTLAVMAAALIGLRGFLEPAHWTVAVDAIHMQAFVERAPATLEGAAWSVDRLAAARAILAAHPELGLSRVPIGPDPLASLPSDRAMVTIGSADRQRIDKRLWSAPFEVPYPSAERFLAAQPDRLWLAAAVNGDVGDGLCRELIAHLAGDAQAANARNPTLLAHMGRRPPRVNVAAANRLHIEYGRELPGAPEPVPARIIIEANDTARIEINARTAARTDRGMAIASFDPWTGDTESWIIGRCDRPTMPPIRDARLRAAYVLRVGESAARPRIPVLGSAPLRVRLDADAWFGSGWHGAEGHGERAFRWTGAREAHVTVAVARSQPIRVRMRATLATGPGVSNALGLSWNGTIIRPIGPWTGGVDHEWAIPAPLVARGLNVLTIHVAELVTPVALGASDTRALGAMVDGLSFEPIPSR